MKHAVLASMNEQINMRAFGEACRAYLNEGDADVRASSEACRACLNE